MKPIHKIGVLFDDRRDDDTFVEAYGQMVVSTGIVIQAPKVFMLENQLNHPLADPNLPGHRIEMNGDEVCHIFFDNTVIKAGDRVVTIKLVPDDFAQDGTMIDGLCYISPLSVLLVIKPDGSTTMMPNNSFVSRIPESRVKELGFDEDDYGFVPNLGVVTYTGVDAYGNPPYKEGDIVIHQGISGQPHVLPDGNLHELLPHSLVFAAIDKKSLKGVLHGLD